MREKIQNFFQNEKVKSLNKKIFNKRNFKIATAVIIVAIASKIAFSLIFEVNGVIQKVDGNNITVANFFTTQTINTGNYPVDSNRIKVGDRIEVTKNIQGQVLYIRDGKDGRSHINKNLGNIDQKNHFNGKNVKGDSNGKY